MDNLIVKSSLFTFILGIISKMSAKPFGLPILSRVSTILFFYAFISISLYAIFHIVITTLDFSIFTMAIVSTIAIGVMLFIGYQIYPLAFLRPAMMISFGLTVLTVVTKIFQLIFL